MVHIKKAESIDELKGILSLQTKNFKENLSENEVNQEGFVTLKHDLALLQVMNSHEPQIIAVDDDIVVGYALIMVSELKDKIPILVSMFKKFESIYYKSQKLSESNYYLMGQVCIDKSYRGKGIFGSMYEKHKTEFGSKYDYCITEVSDSNKRSFRAHEKVGFKSVHSFDDEFDNWHIILLELNDGIDQE